MPARVDSSQMSLGMGFCCRVKSGWWRPTNFRAEWQAFCAKVRTVPNGTSIWRSESFEGECDLGVSSGLKEAVRERPQKVADQAADGESWLAAAAY